MRRNILIGCGALGGIAIVLFLVVFVLAVVRGGSGNSGSSPSPPPSSPPSTSPKKSQDTGNKEAAIGQTVELSDRTFSVNEAERNYVPPTQFTRPQSGNMFVRTNVTITNTSDRQISFNPLEFKLQDADGVQRNYKIISQMPYPLSSGNLAANGEVTGNLVFEAPIGGTDLKLIYKPIGFNSETVTVNV